MIVYPAITNRCHRMQRHRIACCFLSQQRAYIVLIVNGVVWLLHKLYIQLVADNTHDSDAVAGVGGSRMPTKSIEHTQQHTL